MARAPEPDARRHAVDRGRGADRVRAGDEHPGAAQSQPGRLRELIAAGINDWGGVSPVTPDHVNPGGAVAGDRAPARRDRGRGQAWPSGSPIYPEYVREPARWLDSGAAHGRAARRRRRTACAREDAGRPASRQTPPAPCRPRRRDPASRRTLDGDARPGASAGRSRSTRPTSSRCSRRAARNSTRSARRPTPAPEGQRRRRSRYVVNRNINYTNICTYGCRFCAFSKGKLARESARPALRSRAREIARRVREAWERGATEVCMQGGIHPRYTGDDLSRDPARP